MNLWIYLCLASAIIVFFYILKKERPFAHQKHYRPSEQEHYSPSKNVVIEKDYSHSYQRKYLLTKNEYHEYLKLRQYATERRLLVCPKVRLLDIIEPRKGEKNYKTLFYKIQAKHVDFVICDQNLRIKAILELDDNSHNQKNRKDRDTFVDQILTSVGYKVIRVRSITETTLDDLGNPMYLDNCRNQNRKE